MTPLQPTRGKRGTTPLRSGLYIRVDGVEAARGKGLAPHSGAIIVCHQCNLIVDLNNYRGQTIKRAISGGTSHMPVELLVILGAEALLLGFVATMRLHARRMDVLSGRSFERPIVSRGEKRHPARSLRRKLRDLPRVTGRWTISLRSFHRIFYSAPIAKMLLRLLQTRAPPTVRFQTRARRAGAAVLGACDRPAVPSSAGRNTDAQGKHAGPGSMQSSAAAILHQLSAP